MNGLEVLEELGRGAWTVVYRARRQGADYALKVLKTPVADDEHALVAFRREAGLLTCLAHPALARVYEVGSAHGRPYLVMELVEGENLDGLLAGGALDEARVVGIAIEVAGALAAAHRAGLVHRDVKPANIMILPDGQAKVIDFGLAMRTAGGVDESVAGTFAYMAPEQTGMLKRLVDGRSDLYSLGVALFRAATGRLPFAAAEVGELMRLHAVAPPQDVRAIRPDLSPAFAAIVAKLLAKDPDDRYQTAEGLAADLELLRDGEEPSLRDLAAGEIDAPLAGRAVELAELAGRWERARAGEGGAVVVRGAPGIGKSRLVRELVAIARGAGAVVLEGKSVPDDPMPLAPIRSALEQHLRAAHQLPPAESAAALDRVRAAARPVGALLRTLSPALADLLDAPSERADEDRQEQFAVAVAAFLAGLAGQAGGAILWLDDVQWLDPATRRVLRHLATDLPGTPLLVVVTARDDAESREAAEAVAADLAHAVDSQLDLRSLDDGEIGELLAAHLGGAAVTRELTAQLAARSGGNPFTAVEYLRAAVDAGLIRPSWGVWMLDEGGLDAVELPEDVLRLILSRVDGLGGDSRRMLAAAAAIGMRFRADRLAEVCDVDEQRVLDVIRVAMDRRLLGPGGSGEHAFVHDRIREALLADLGEHDLQSLHQRIAEALAASTPAGSEDVYAIARHYSHGEVDRTPAPVFHACFAAGQVALAEYAPQEALTFLEAADTAATKAGIEPDGRFHAALGLANLRVGQYVEARDRLSQALAAEPDRNRRAVLHGMVGETHHSCYELEPALAAVRRALAELGRPLPERPLRLVLSTLCLFVGGLLVKWLRLGFGSVTSGQRERYQLECWLNGVAAHTAVKARSKLLMSCLDLRSVYPANRLGMSPEHLSAYSHLAGALRLIGLTDRSDRLYRRLYRTAEAFGDPRTVAYLAWNDGVVRYVAGSSQVHTGELLRRVLTEHGRWLDADEYLLAAGLLCDCLTFCGHPREALAWYERAHARVTNYQQARGHTFAGSGVSIQALLDHGQDAAARLRAIREFLAEQPDNEDARVNYMVVAFLAAVENDQLGDDLDALADDLRRLGVGPTQVWPAQRVLWVNLAYGRLAQCIAAGDAERSARLEAARAAIRDVRRAAGTAPLLRAHYRILRGAYRQLTGDQHGALREAAGAERIAVGLDAPLLEFEIARVRARALRSLGHAAEADRLARIGLLLALEHGWEHRVRWIRSEFRVADVSNRALASTSSELNRRRLEALQQVSMAAARVLDPRELARVALDETVRILGAERAFTFVVDSTGSLVPDLGRDADGADLDVLTGYPTSLVERVHTSGEPLVVTSDEEGRALGSQSAAAHGLRSIMVAPLQVKGRLLGVVYLDSRVARGIFTSDDVDILMAIINHVAVSLETAQAAQLEVAVQAARQQLDLAEALRTAMSQISQTLDPDEVLDRLLAAMARTVPGEAACLLRNDREGLLVTAVRGPVDAAAVGRRVDPAADAALAALTDATLPVPGTAAAGQAAPLPEVLVGVRSWLTIPLSGQAGLIAFLLIGSTAADAYTQADVEIAAVLAGHGVAAYQNAVLAATDSLTGVYNRRHFFELASRSFGAARAQCRPLSAVMIDIDHFKQINDQHGHLVGDEVIREIARRLRCTVRESDLLGRYGGEEFALVIDVEADTDELAERLRTVVASCPVDTLRGRVSTTVSVGIARLNPDCDPDLDTLLARADEALYRAKRQGRNQVAIA